MVKVWEPPRHTSNPKLAASLNNPCGFGHIILFSRHFVTLTHTMRLLAASLTAPWRWGLYKSSLFTNYPVHPQYITRWWWLSENCYVRPQSNTPAYKLSTVGKTGAFSFPSEFIHHDLVPSQATLSIVLIAFPNFKTYVKNYTRFKLYHLSSKHKIICNRNYYSSEALLVLYLPLVCFRLGSLLTGAGHGSQATKWRHATCIYETKNNTLPLVCTSCSTPFCCLRKWESILWTSYLLGHRSKRNA